MRHGDAVSVGENGVTSDFDRMLTPEGRHKTEMVAKFLKRMGVDDSCVVSSPLVRARETAEILARCFAKRGVVQELDLLAQGSVPEKINSWLIHHKKESVILVGHMPDLADLAAYFISPSGDSGLLFKKSGVCCIEFDGKPGEGAGVLCWLVHPSVIKHLA
jgi:phosphohistidine phosphatase